MCSIIKIEMRPRMFETVNELQKEIDEYFNIEEKPTLTGLAYFLGFESRQSIYDYEGKPEFSYTIKRARLRIENEYEKRLTENSCTGAIFALKNLGWKDKTEVEQSGGIEVNFKETRNYNKE